MPDTRCFSFTIKDAAFTPAGWLSAEPTLQLIWRCSKGGHRGGSSARRRLGEWKRDWHLPDASRPPLLSRNVLTLAAPEGRAVLVSLALYTEAEVQFSTEVHVSLGQVLSAQTNPTLLSSVFSFKTGAVDATLSIASNPWTAPPDPTHPPATFSATPWDASARETPVLDFVAPKNIPILHARRPSGALAPHMALEADVFSEGALASAGVCLADEDTWLVASVAVPGAGGGGEAKGLLNGLWAPLMLGMSWSRKKPAAQRPNLFDVARQLGKLSYMQQQGLLPLEEEIATSNAIFHRYLSAAAASDPEGDEPDLPAPHGAAGNKKKAACLLTLAADTPDPFLRDFTRPDLPRNLQPWLASLAAQLSAEESLCERIDLFLDANCEKPDGTSAPGDGAARAGKKRGKRAWAAAGDPKRKDRVSAFLARALLVAAHRYTFSRVPLPALAACCPAEFQDRLDSANEADRKLRGAWPTWRSFFAKTTAGGAGAVRACPGLWGIPGDFEPDAFAPVAARLASLNTPAVASPYDVILTVHQASLAINALLAGAAQSPAARRCSTASDAGPQPPQPQADRYCEAPAKAQQKHEHADSGERDLPAGDGLRGLKEAHFGDEAPGGPAKPAGADAFFPVLLYCVSCAEVAAPARAVLVASEFYQGRAKPPAGPAGELDKVFVTSEMDYYFTCFAAAIAYFAKTDPRPLLASLDSTHTPSGAPAPDFDAFSNTSSDEWSDTTADDESAVDADEPSPGDDPHPPQLGPASTGQPVEVAEAFGVEGVAGDGLEGGEGDDESAAASASAVVLKAMARRSDPAGAGVAGNTAWRDWLRRRKDQAARDRANTEWLDGEKRKRAAAPAPAIWRHHRLIGRRRGWYWRKGLKDRVHMTPSAFVCHHAACVGETALSRRLNQKARTADLLNLDLMRTLVGFGPAVLKQADVYVPRLKALLQAFVEVRPDCGYVQGMGYIALMFILHSDDSPEAFVGFSAVLEAPIISSFYNFDTEEMELQFRVFDRLLYQVLPALSAHLTNNGVMTRTFLFDWWMTLWCRQFDHDRIAAPLWNLYLGSGAQPHLLHAICIGILNALAPRLLQSEAEAVLIMLSQLREMKLDAAVVVSSVDAIVACVPAAKYELAVEFVRRRDEAQLHPSVPAISQLPAVARYCPPKRFHTRSRPKLPPWDPPATVQGIVAHFVSNPFPHRSAEVPSLLDWVWSYPKHMMNSKWDHLLRFSETEGFKGVTCAGLDFSEWLDGLLTSWAESDDEYVALHNARKSGLVFTEQAFEVNLAAPAWASLHALVGTVVGRVRKAAAAPSGRRPSKFYAVSDVPPHLPYRGWTPHAYLAVANGPVAIKGASKPLSSPTDSPARLAAQRVVTQAGVPYWLAEAYSLTLGFPSIVFKRGAYLKVVDSAANAPRRGGAGGRPAASPARSAADSVSRGGSGLRDDQALLRDADGVLVVEVCSWSNGYLPRVCEVTVTLEGPEGGDGAGAASGTAYAGATRMHEPTPGAMDTQLSLTEAFCLPLRGPHELSGTLRLSVVLRSLGPQPAPVFTLSPAETVAYTVVPSEAGREVLLDRWFKLAPAGETHRPPPSLCPPSSSSSGDPSGNSSRLPRKETPRANRTQGIGPPPPAAAAAAAAAAGLPGAVTAKVRLSAKVGGRGFCAGLKGRRQQQQPLGKLAVLRPAAATLGELLAREFCAPAAAAPGRAAAGGVLSFLTWDDLVTGLGRTSKAWATRVEFLLVGRAPVPKRKLWGDAWGTVDVLLERAALGKPSRFVLPLLVLLAAEAAGDRPSEVAPPGSSRTEDEYGVSVRAVESVVELLLLQDAGVWPPPPRGAAAGVADLPSRVLRALRRVFDLFFRGAGADMQLGLDLAYALHVNGSRAGRGGGREGDAPGQPGRNETFEGEAPAAREQPETAAAREQPETEIIQGEAPAAREQPETAAAREQPETEIIQGEAPAAREQPETEIIQGEAPAAREQPETEIIQGEAPAARGQPESETFEGEASAAAGANVQPAEGTSLGEAQEGEKPAAAVRVQRANDTSLGEAQEGGTPTTAVGGTPTAAASVQPANDTALGEDHDSETPAAAVSVQRANDTSLGEAQEGGTPTTAAGVQPASGAFVGEDPSLEFASAQWAVAAECLRSALQADPIGVLPGVLPRCVQQQPAVGDGRGQDGGFQGYTLALLRDCGLLQAAAAGLRRCAGRHAALLAPLAAGAAGATPGLGPSYTQEPGSKDTPEDAAACSAGTRTRDNGGVASPARPAEETTPSRAQEEVRSDRTAADGLMVRAEPPPTLAGPGVGSPALAGPGAGSTGGAQQQQRVGSGASPSGGRPPDAAAAAAFLEGCARVVGVACAAVVGLFSRPAAPGDAVGSRAADGLGRLALACLLAASEAGILGSAEPAFETLATRLNALVACLVTTANRGPGPPIALATDWVCNGGLADGLWQVVAACAGAPAAGEAAGLEPAVLALAPAAVLLAGGGGRRPSTAAGLLSRIPSRVGIPTRAAALIVSEFLDPERLAGDPEGEEGEKVGEKDGRTESEIEGETDGRNERETEGGKAGEKDGQTEGYRVGKNDGQTDSKKEGGEAGEKDGRTEGEKGGGNRGEIGGQAEGEREGEKEGNTLEEAVVRSLSAHAAHASFPTFVAALVAHSSDPFRLLLAVVEACGSAAGSAQRAGAIPFLTAVVSCLTCEPGSSPPPHLSRCLSSQSSLPLRFATAAVQLHRKSVSDLDGAALEPLTFAIVTKLAGMAPELVCSILLPHSS
ncbi:Drainin [Diplonema papillatum]|nr:Drainin [Diplonema papillatum]